MKKIKEITKSELEDFTIDQLEQLVMITNDDQGDTTIYDMMEYKGLEEDWLKMSNSELIDMILEETNANMTIFIWIENNNFSIVRFLDFISEYDVSKDIDFDQPFISKSMMVKTRRVQFR